MITGLDWVNPVLVREYQQFVRSRAFLWIGALWLIAQLLISLLFVVTSNVQRAVFSLDGPGQSYFWFIMGALGVVFFFVFPVSTFNRLVRERKEMTLELLTISRIRPGQIAMGMLLVVTMQILLFLFLCFPFVSFAYLCRGLELKTVLWSLYSAMIGAVAVNAATLAIASFCKTPRVTMIVRALFILAVVFGLIPGVSMFFSLFVARRFGYAHSTAGPEFDWLTVLLTTVAAIGTVLTALVFTRSNLTFESANRTTWPRLTVAGWFVVGHVIMWICKATGILDDEAAVAFDVIGFIGLIAFTCWLMGESNALGPRLLESVPRNGLLRLLTFPFLPGRGSGFVYFIFIGVLQTVSLFFLIAPHFDRDMENYFVIKASIVFFFGAAALVHHLLQFTRFRRWHFIIWFLITAFIIFWLPIVFGARPWDNYRSFIFIMDADQIRDSVDWIFAATLRGIVAPIIGILCALPSVIQNIQSIAAKR
jgi:hypothetical protein